MNLNSVGVILRQMPYLHKKTALLDKTYGRIDGVVNSSYKSVGTLISYTISNKRGTIFLQDIQCLYMPLSLGKFDVLFLHHIFEIIYYFAPVGSSVHGIFDLLAFLYTVEHMLVSIKCKKFFLFKLLNLLGISPEIEGSYVLYMRQLYTIDIKTFEEAMIDNIGEKILDKWLWLCIWQHPYVNEFKTVHFLEKNRAI